MMVEDIGWQQFPHFHREEESEERGKYCKACQRNHLDHSLFDVIVVAFNCLLQGLQKPAILAVIAIFGSDFLQNLFVFVLDSVKGVPRKP